MTGRLLYVLAHPFEAGIAALVAVQAATALLGWGIVDPSEALLPGWLSTTLTVGYLLAGAAILAGMLWPRGDVEGAGLVLLLAGLVTRAVLFGFYLHWSHDAVTALAYSLLFAGACLARLRMLAPRPLP